MATYTFFTNPMSRGQIARWALHEVGADYDTELVEWAAKSEAFLKANPLGKVPTLVHHHGDHVHVVTEAAAICHYLAEMHPEAGLLPEAHEKAAYFRRLFFASGPVEQAIMARSMGWDVKEPQKQATAGFGSYERAMDTLDTLLSDRDFVCGDRFTMADVYVGSQVDWGLQFGTIPKRAVFEDYAARLRERPAYKEAKAIDMALIAEAQGS
ncbi:glutathione S-transferase family protein [Qipengyuania vesicularis]|uniref:glutathione S-transferase family protein n=1 Tax=Qipengyuania vesicularis TaxID=2867232 RepID=UPI001C87A9E8|nr:glutathione S-transferase family protein [Qipengyuania vesicularis]MBX7526281.1 glutathione S-transferase family protein [Qipengyuania vesicularis]